MIFLRKYIWWICKIFRKIFSNYFNVHRRIWTRRFRWDNEMRSLIASLLHPVAISGWKIENTRVRASSIFLRSSSLDPPTLAGYYFPRVYNHLARLGANAISSDRSILINYIVVPGSRESSRVKLSHPRNTEVSSSRIEVIRRGGISRFPEDITYLPCGKDCEPDRPIIGTWPRSRSIIPARYLSLEGARGQAARTARYRRSSDIAIASMPAHAVGKVNVSKFVTDKEHFPFPGRRRALYWN